MSTETPPNWPEPDRHDTEVMLLGTYHMDNPGLDVANVDADDVLAAERQRQLRELTDRLATWEPTAVAVERPFDRQTDIDALYDEYRTGERSYDEETAIDPPHPMRSDTDTECRSEVIQVGFRLADRLDHARVHAVDHPTTMAANLDDDEAEQLDFEAMIERASERLDAPVPSPAEHKRAADEHLSTSTIPAYLRWVNREGRLHMNHDAMFAAGIAGGDERGIGSRLLSAWYERNLRIVENLWCTADPDDDRLFLVVGSGHVHVLRQLLEEMPGVCPTSPLPLLD